MLRNTWERAELTRALARLPCACPDCGTASYHVGWHAITGRWRVRVFHLESCVCRRHAPSRRACDRWLMDMLAAQGLYVADYCDVVAGLHR